MWRSDKVFRLAHENSRSRHGEWQAPSYNRRFTCRTLAAMPNLRQSAAPVSPLLAGVLLAALASAPLQAQDDAPDTRAPVIELEVLTEVAAADSQSFNAQVADDGELASVTLHHRREGDGPFVRSTMRALGGSGYFGVSIPTDRNDTSAIEYYIQAIDESGNRTVNGFAFDPLRRAFTEASLPLATAPNAATDAAAGGVIAKEAPRAASNSRRWWTVALGVVAVGALATLSGGGGDDDNGNVPLTIDVPRPGSR